MELVSLRCNREFTSASSYGLSLYKYPIATQWYQFRTTDAWWFSLSIKIAFWQKWMLHLYIKPSYSFNWTRLSISVLHKWRINIYKRHGSFFNLIRLYFPELFYCHCVNHTLALIQVKHNNTEYVYTSNSDPLKFRLWSKSNTERQEGEHILWGSGTSMHYKSMVSVWKWHKIIHSSYTIVQSFLLLSRLYILILHYS